MSFQAQGLQTRFFAAPHGSAASTARSVLLCVHGRGGKKELMEWIPKRFEIEGLDFLSVQAPFPEDVKEMKSPGFSWYLREGESYKGLEESRQLLQTLVKDLKAYAYASHRIFWIGFSQGGVMGLDLFLRSNEVLGGVMNISGFCIEPETYPAALGSAIQDQKIICTHGKRDEIVSFDRVKLQYEALQNQSVPLEFREFSKPHSFELRNEIPFLIERLKSWITA